MIQQAEDETRRHQDPGCFFDSGLNSEALSIILTKDTIIRQRGKCTLQLATLYIDHELGNSTKLPRGNNDR